MAVIIGSARIDERGKISGGSNKNNAAIEVSRQEWYPHSKGWYVLRAIDPEVREKIAQNMEYACDSKYIGYDQSQNTTLYHAVKSLGFDISKLKTYCETDCARLVRVHILYAGINVPDFYTGNLKESVMGTGKFKLYTSDDYCKSSKKLLRGDILVTRTKGHVVVVLSDGSLSEETKPAVIPVSSNVESGQAWLNKNYRDLIVTVCGEELDCDGECGKITRKACVGVWKDVVNRKYGCNLTPTNSNFYESCKKAAKKAVIEIGASGTLVLIAQLILSAKGFYKGKMDAKFESVMEDAVVAYQKAVGLKADGIIGADTWYALFN